VVEIVNRVDIIDDETTAGCQRKVRKKFEKAIQQKHKSKMFQKVEVQKGNRSSV
jgi:hypothetical protein